MILDRRSGRREGKKNARAMINAVAAVFKNRLVGEYIDSGRAVLEALRRKKIPVTEAFWYDLPERDQWRFSDGSCCGANRSLHGFGRRPTSNAEPLVPR